MHRLFLDANVLFSAAFRENAPLRWLWKQSGVELLTSAYAITEAERHLEGDQRVRLSELLKGVRIVPEASRTGENAPSHRVFVGRVEIGAAWSKRSNEGREYLGLKLDDPSFNAPIFANLFNDEEGEGYSLIWSRPSRRAD